MYKLQLNGMCAMHFTQIGEYKFTIEVCLLVFFRSRFRIKKYAECADSKNTQYTNTYNLCSIYNIHCSINFTLTFLVIISTSEQKISIN